jgi:hypothetical protein
MAECDGKGRKLLDKLDDAIEATAAAELASGQAYVLHLKYAFGLHVVGCEACTENPPQGKYWKPIGSSNAR